MKQSKARNPGIKFRQCGLCGSLVKELEKQGYCEQCRLLIEALIKK